ncbi:DNA internalization-related competence protein ComEC/Rec2 [Bacillus testis]|uniref:DNA internalization-related competence protein ComEC/Rec2 n=1 Tax=Bacillus testis TaxID=1622072 RepID=UPI00067F1098|nr:DNA internalization-related competence protein ComEC/Rec2 [Bacillus testis]
MIMYVAAGAILGVAAFFFPSLPLWVTALFLLLAVWAPRTKGFLILLCSFYLFLSSTYLHAYFQKTSLAEGEGNVSVLLTDLPDIDGYSFQTVALLGKEKVILRYHFRSEQEKKEMQAAYALGLQCNIKGTLEAPEKNRNQNGFNYQFYLQMQGINWILKSDAFPLQSCTPHKKTIPQLIKNIRLQGLKHIDAVFPEESRGFAAALIFGESSWIDDNTYTAYQRLSLVHILAISGMHVTILSAAFFYVAIRCGFARETVQILLIALMPVYGILAGGAPSVMRACIMVMLFLLLSLLKARWSAITVLGTLFLIYVFVDPFAMVQVGFQLSFFITFSLLMSHLLLQSLRTSSKWVQTFLVTLICQLSSLPILLYYFQSLSLWGFIWNMVYIPLYTFYLLPFTFLAFFLSLLHGPFLSQVLFLIEKSFVLSNKAALFLSEAPLIQMAFAKPGRLFIFVLAAAIVALFIGWEKRKWKQVMASGGAVACMLFSLYGSVHISPWGEITVIDVGQGDSILIKRPHGDGVYLIDTGGILPFGQEAWQEKRKSFEPGRDLVVPFLNSKGIRKLDALILTHDDEDHIGGARAVIEELDIKEIVIAEALADRFMDSDAWKAATKKKVPIRLVRDGDGWNKGKDLFQVLHPDAYEGNSNDTSLVIWAKINGISWLFTGDLGEKGEEALLKRYPDLQADVLKVGHHGSKTSSSAHFLDRIAPKAAWISAGKKNRYGHPHAQVLELIEKRHIQIYRSDLQGSIMYKYRQGHKGTFSVMLP